MRIDKLKKCAEKSCNNLARINCVINDVVKRGKLCEKHHRVKHPRTPKSWRHLDNFKICNVCKWEGPCDKHRVRGQGKYIKENVLSICPNCHRLHHRGIKLIDNY